MNIFDRFRAAISKRNKGAEFRDTVALNQLLDFLGVDLDKEIQLVADELTKAGRNRAARKFLIVNR